MDGVFRKMSLGVVLVVAYAVLWALFDLLALLPGNPSFSSDWGLVGALLIQGLLVWRLFYGSTLAWALGLIMALGTGASMVLVGPPFGATEVLFAVVCLAQVGVLLTPPLRGLIWPHRPTPPASA